MLSVLSFEIPECELKQKKSLVLPYAVTAHMDFFSLKEKVTFNALLGCRVIVQRSCSEVNEE